MLRDYLKNLFGNSDQIHEKVHQINQSDELEEFYHELQEDILDTAHAENKLKVTRTDIWEIIIREGLYQNLTENPSIAIGFLLITNHGPTATYKRHLDLADNHNQVIILIALSALVKDVEHLNKGRMDNIRQGESKYTIGDVIDLDYDDKLDYINKFTSGVDNDIQSLDFFAAIAARTDNQRGLYDRPLIHFLNTSEKLKFLFKANNYGYSISENDKKIHPTGNGCAYHLLTNKRVLTAVGRKNYPDSVLSIPLSSIKRGEIHTGWTKTRVEIHIKEQYDENYYNIWVQSIKSSNESDILEYLKK
jgi:hypothetical protein